MSNEPNTRRGIRADLSFGSQKIEVETGGVAKQAAGSVMVQVGGTVILAAATVAPEPKEGQDWFPLTVDYRERTYAAGKIPGGFFKRETRPRDHEILTSRLIDRSIRPLFPEGFKNSVQVNTIVLSCDQSNDTDIPSIVGASLALSLSEIPFSGPLSAVRVGLINGEFVINPTIEQQQVSSLDLVVSGTQKGIIMMEGGSREVSEEKMLEALDAARKAILSQCKEQEEFISKHGKSKMNFTPTVPPEDLARAVEESARAKLKEAIRTAEKMKRENSIFDLKREIQKSLAERFPEQEVLIGELIEGIIFDESREMILKEKRRTDGRKCDEIRPIACETAVLPRTHGSAIFTRGQTQSLATVTLGTPGDMQIMDELGGEYKERFLFHYNFPGFATGEAKMERGPGRREIGHGALARRALLPLIPGDDEFPYTIRIVSDILESNGSSSMASVCGGSLALFDAGVPMKSPCAGIAMGLMVADPKDPNREFAVLSDIMGLEDHVGDMDFKVAGTAQGITAIQMDTKIDCVTAEMLKIALAQAKDGRSFILGKLNDAITSPRGQLSVYAPKMVLVKIPVDKIGALIGPGGKNIKRIIEETGAEVEVEDDGRVSISGMDMAGIEMAKRMVEGTAAEVEVGKIYKGKVTRIMNFGAFVEVLPGKEGLVHISQLDTSRVERVEDVVKEGDEIEVKCVEIDSQGRVNLSRKAVLNPDSETELVHRRPERGPHSSRPGPHRRGRG